MTPEDATRALAHRLRLAAATPWPGDRCDAEAAAFVAELQARGWRQRPMAPVPAPARRDPETAVRGANLARAVLRSRREAAETGPRATDAAERPPVGVSGPTGPAQAVLGPSTALDPTGDA